MTLRLILFGMILLLSIIPSVSGQESRERELRPAFDFTTIQMPIEIVSIKLNGRDVKPGEKIRGNDDWLQGLSFTLRNISNKPIAYVAMSLRFEQPKRIVGIVLPYGVDYSRGEPRSGTSPLPIQPNETVELAFTSERYANFLKILRTTEMPRSFDVVPYLVERVSFEDDFNVIWEGGYLKRRSPAEIGKFDIIERYKLPAKQ
jgi:hypothetical protein